jgi:hypothetical protein
MKYLFSQCYLHADGRVTIPAELVARWNRQLNTLYEELPEEEKESDRVEADRMLSLMNEEKGSGRIKEFGEELETLEGEPTEVLREMLMCSIYSGNSVSDTAMIFVALTRQYDGRIAELEKKVDELAQQFQR